MKKTILFLFMASTVAVSAQSKWSYKLGFGGEMKSGNVNTTIFSNNGSVERNDSLLSASASYGIVYGMKDKEVYDRGLTTSLQADLWQYDRWSPFVLGTYLNNKFKGFEYKFSGLLGVKYRLYTLPDVCDYSLSAAYVQEWVEYFAADRTDERLRPQVSRLSLRFKVKQKIGNFATLKHTTFYQPSLMELAGLASIKDDYVVTSVTSIESKLTEHLSLAFNFSYEYRSVVPEGVKNTDIITSASLNLKF